MKAQLVCDALTMAIWQRQPKAGLIVHSDQGVQYASLVVQTEDIIYVEPRRRIAANVLREITPFVTLLSSVLLTITTLQALSALNN